VIDVYGGPTSAGFANRYRPGIAETAYGVIIARMDNRGTTGRGTAFQRAVHRRLGDVDLGDQAAGARQLAQRPYIDADRVGIYGDSYGGFMAALAILKYPDVFSVAVAGSSVTDWRNYDTIYTERYMSTPQLNPEGYKAGAAATHADKLTGRMLIMHGMMDDNVHPNNAFQLIAALDEAGKSYESRFWPNGAHGLGRGSGDTQNEFFDRVLRPEEH
jgi:dipeptidyl-peptidase-4